MDLIILTCITSVLFFVYLLIKMIRNHVITALKSKIFNSKMILDAHFPEDTHTVVITYTEVIISEIQAVLTE